MIAAWFALSIECRLGILALVGVGLGALANHVIYTHCWFPRPISPWGPAAADAPPRKATDRIPILGWFGLRREREIHGGGFWCRPLLIEVAMAIGVPAFYFYETQSGLLFPQQFRAAAALVAFEPWMTQMFFFHLVMLFLMVAATFIDFDEQTIPDMITIPGTLFALVTSAISMQFFLPAPPPADVPFATFQIPAAFGPPWNGPQGFWTGILIWSIWCFALADRRVILRKGFAKAVEFFLAGLVRHPAWKFLLGMWFAGLVAIFMVFQIGGDHWWGLLSSVVGLGVGGGVVWAIRIVAGVAMRVEALGFGDVTLMAMLGAFLGWQAAVLGFFLAPISAIVIVLIYFVITRESRVPFGPYLCAGTLLTVLFWDRLITWMLLAFIPIGGQVGWLFVGLVGAMGGILFVWRIIKEALLQ